MPISEKIEKSIRELDLAEDIKQLMTAILDKEDQGVKQYKKEYEKMVDDLIEARESDRT